MKKRWTTVVSGFSTKETVTKRGADGWTRTAQGAGLNARTERLAKCRRCDIHGCPGTCED
jgi:hypothetical protein